MEEQLWIKFGDVTRLVIDYADLCEIERMSRLRRFLPPQVADLIVASGSEKQLESHRREITAPMAITAWSANHSCLPPFAFPAFCTPIVLNCAFCSSLSDA